MTKKTILSNLQVILPKQFTDHAEVMNIPGMGEVSVTIKKWIKSRSKDSSASEERRTTVCSDRYVVIGS